ncbi:Signal transduction histidine kinase [Lentzea albidocapillata subsp. violacea]|uniref:histidine kinase n=1 Tax=Lentzea albidocapillata subsp. violacea TaxID=128104 RepID=A0A1G9IZX7_9PSEU|nr:Signal transduction histidine kinase [Lentzea albidocapillata subsp. violacea]
MMVAVWEVLLYLVLFGAAFAVVRNRPAVALGTALGTWLGCYLVTVDFDVRVVALTPALALVSFLAGRNADDPRPTAIALTIAEVAGVVVALTERGGSDTALAVTSGIGVLGVVPWAFGRFRRRYGELQEVGWEHASLLERSVENARNAERARLAGEMHDLVGHELARAALLTGALELEPTLTAQQREAAKTARASVTAAAERLADVMQVLRADEDEPVATIEEVVARSGLDVELVNGRRTAIDGIIARTVHRVTAEALTNVIKHAPGAKVTVSLSANLELRITNGPAPRTQAVGSGKGLVGLAERVALVGGWFEAAPSDDGGFEVRAKLPERPRARTTPTHVHRERTEKELRKSAKRTVLITTVVCAGIAIGVPGYMVFDAVTSVLTPQQFERAQFGQHEDTLDLPLRTRVDNPLGVTAPPGTECRYYSTHPNPFDGDRHDLHQLCFRDDRLVSKQWLARRSG